MRMNFENVAGLPDAEPVITLSADTSTWIAVVNMIQEILERESPEPIVVASRAEQDLTEAVVFLEHELLNVANDSDLKTKLPLPIYQSVVCSVMGYKNSYTDKGVDTNIPPEVVNSIFTSLLQIAEEKVNPIVLPYAERFVYAVK